MLLGLVVLGACGTATEADDTAPAESSTESALLGALPLSPSKTTGAHTFDYASKAPARLSIMFSMAWFGIQDNVGDSPLHQEPQTPFGKDPTYHNWQAASGGCALVDPQASESNTCIRLGTNNQCIDRDPKGVEQRNISSRRRPLTGIWSGTGRDDESRRKIDLMLSMLRRPGCRLDDGAKLDAWTMQNNSIKFSSKYVANPGASADLPYRTMMALYDRADLHQIPNAVMAGFDSTWYFNFGNTKGLGDCDDIPKKNGANPRSSCLSALQSDIRDLAVEANGRASAVKVCASGTGPTCVGGKPVIFIYTDPYQAQGKNKGHQPTASEWVTLLSAARREAGFDFYAIGVGDDTAFFGAFDALAPWIGKYDAKASVYADAYAHTVERHANLLAGVGKYPGRLVYGGVTPGFDDWTNNWTGPCTVRQMPPGLPRDPRLMSAQTDFFTNCVSGTSCSGSMTKYPFRGFIGETWDDWTEGSEFEPDVYEGTAKLVLLRQLFGKVFGDAFPDQKGDDRLDARWKTYGQARNGSGGAAHASPITDLSCDVPACSPPTILEPTSNESVGAAIHLRVSAPACIGAIKCYVDSNTTPVASGTDAVDAWVPVTPGKHSVQCNGWNASGAVSGSAATFFTR